MQEESEATETQEYSTARLTAEMEMICREMRNSIFPGTDSFVTTTSLAEMALSIADAAKERLHEQEKKLKALEKLAVTDELTGSLNRRGFKSRMEGILSDANRHGENGFLIYIDIDNFKDINDNYGHAAGDKALKKITEILKDNLRNSDVISRLGGDEFAILMPRCKLEGEARIRQIQYTINNTNLVWGNHIIQMKASFGILEFTGEDDMEELMKAADMAMYSNKISRNEANVATVVA